MCFVLKCLASGRNHYGKTKILNHFISVMLNHIYQTALNNSSLIKLRETERRVSSDYWLGTRPDCVPFRIAFNQIPLYLDEMVIFNLLQNEQNLNCFIIFIFTTHIIVHWYHKFPFLHQFHKFHFSFETNTTWTYLCYSIYLQLYNIVR